MAISAYGMIIPLVVIAITGFLFLINHSIYARTRKGSYAFMCWAIAAASYLMGSIVYLAGTILTGGTFLFDLLDHVLFGMLSGFFVLLGVLFLGADTKVFRYDKEELRSLQVPFIIISVVSFFFVIAPVYMGLAAEGTVLFIATLAGAAVQLVLWSAASVMFLSVYKAVKKGTKAWLLIYLSMISISVASLAEVLVIIGYTAFDIIYLLAGLSFIILLFPGFLLLRRSLKA